MHISKRSRLLGAWLSAAGATLAIPASAQLEAGFAEHKAGGLEFTLITGDKVQAAVKADGSLAGIRLLDENGSEAITSIFKRGDATYVVPPKAQALVDAGAIDLELFNIDKLQQAGYDDASTDRLPIIVSYADGTLAGAATPVELSGMSLTGEIEIIDAAAFGVSKADAAAVWSELTRDIQIEGVWLDAMVTAHKTSIGASLTPTVPLTGARGKYAAGFDGAGVKVAVLDTGYDTEHADLAGQVIAAQDFSWSSRGVDDLDGHGTHVASTVAGTGAESDGLWAGMAPGANLIIGKVLNDSGSGSTYGILNGMAWAVSQGAEVVNMSLGSTATACAGPLVDMVEALSNQALFVISAGNNFTRETVGSPGCAPSALTVGAVDRNNDTASFSSRGPSPDGHSAKPDISSQGVDVVAAASGGNGATAYRSLSGTSMSAPHVAGGAAIVMQARPELSPRQVKAVLTSSVIPTNAHVLEQGAGPMDVNQAVVQALAAAPNAELGYFDHGAGDGLTEGEVWVENLSDKDLSLKLKLSLIGEDGITQLPATLAGLGVKEVTLPAHGGAAIPVWVDPGVALRSGAYGTITGRIEGTSTGLGEQRLSVPLSFWIGHEMTSLSFSVTDQRGNPATPPSKVYVINEEDDWGQYVSVSNGSASVDVPVGNYSIVAHIMTYDNDGSYGGLVESAAQMAYLDYRVHAETHLDFDARSASRLSFKAEQALDTQGFSFGFTYALDDEKFAKLAAIELAPDYVDSFYGWSQGYDDRFRAFTTTRAVAPEAVFTTQGGQVLEPVKQGLALSFHGEGSAEVVPVGDGGYATDWSQFDLEGKIALIGNPYYLASYMVSNAMREGAIGVIFYRPGNSGRYKGTIAGTPRIPVAGLSSEQGEALMAEVVAGDNRVSWSGTAAERSPYAYSIHHLTEGRIDTGLVTVHEQKMQRISAAYHSQNDERPAWTDVMAATSGTGEFYSTGSPQLLLLPRERDEYYTATGDRLWTNIVMPGARLSSTGGYFDGPRSMTAGSSEQTNWFKGPRGGSLLSSGVPIATRDTNLLHMSFAAFGDSDGHDGIGGYAGSGAYGLRVNGEAAYLSNSKLTVPDSQSDIELEVRYYLRGVGERSPINDYLGSFYQGIYRFSSDASQQGAQRVLMPAIDVPLSIENTAPAGQAVAIELAGLVDGLGPVDLANVTLQYGYGQECLIDGVSAFSYCPVSTRFSAADWQDAEVTLRDGAWFATVPNDAAPGEFVHLRVEMSDSAGSSAEQVMMRAYMLD